MTTTPRPQQPAVMALIEQQRRRLGMSMRAAAALAGMSEARWRQLEKGWREIRGVQVAEEAPDLTLARMAWAVRLAPGDIKDQRPEAAQMLADLAAQRRDDNKRNADDAARMVEALGSPTLSHRQREALQAEIAEALRRLRQE